MLYLGNGLYSDRYLCHHGIKGQRWGVRNGPPYPLEYVDKKRISSTVNYVPTKNRPHTDYNLDNWGKNKDTNILWVTGISGSGKSTLAKSIAKKHSSDYINIDTYTFKTTSDNIPGQSKRFNKYLDKNYPEWKRLQREAYEAGIDRIHRHNKWKCGLWFDTLEEALLNYGKDSYGKKKVVAEGVQVLDETLFYNSKDKLKNKPLIVMDTDITDSILSGMTRDNRSVNKQLSEERIKQINSWARDIKSLKSTMTKTSKDIASDIHKKAKSDEKKPVGNQNCMLCTWCAELNFRGKNVMPRPVYSPRDIIFTKDESKIVENADKKKVTSSNYVKRLVSSSPEGSRFYTHVNWKNSSGGHEFLVINDKGKAKVLDAQSGTYDSIDGKNGKYYFTDINPKNSYIFRIDNQALNPSMLELNSDIYIKDWDESKDIPYMKKHGML